MANSIVTGASGSVGGYLIRELLRKEDSGIIKAIYTGRSGRGRFPEAENPRIQWILGDILDINFLLQVIESGSFVYHCAAFISFSKQDETALYTINQQGTAHIVDACLFKSAAKLVYIHSIAGMGRIAGVTTFDESYHWVESPLNSTYGKSKFLGELEVWRGIAEGLEASIVIPSVILGNPIRSKNSNKYIDHILQSNNIAPGGGTGFVDVRDVARMCIFCMEQKIPGHRVLCSGMNIRYYELYEMIAISLQKDCQLKILGKNQMDWLWKKQAIKSFISNSPPKWNKGSARHASIYYQYSSKKSTDVLGFQYQNPQDTVRQWCDAYLLMIQENKKEYWF